MSQFLSVLGAQQHQRENSPGTWDQPWRDHPGRSTRHSLGWPQIGSLPLRRRFSRQFLPQSERFRNRARPKYEKTCSSHSSCIHGHTVSFWPCCDGKSSNRSISSLRSAPGCRFFVRLRDAHVLSWWVQTLHQKCISGERIAIDSNTFSLCFINTRHDETVHSHPAECCLDG